MSAGWWEGHPWRLIQTNLREIDMADIEADRYVADLLSFQATVTMINTSGIIASYPTQLDFHTQSAFLHGDSLKTIIAACHDAGIKVIARTDFSKVRRPLYERHPEWAYRTSAGQIVDENGDVHVCINGGYQQECAPLIVEETLTTLDVDGIYFNMAGFQAWDYAGKYHGLCHCASCEYRFRELFNSDLPAKEDLDDTAYRHHLLFQDRVSREHRERIATLIRGLRADFAIDQAFDTGRGFMRQESNTALDRALPDWQHSASANTKWVVGSFPEMVSSNTSVEFIDYPVRHVAVAPQRQSLRLAQGLANGGGLDYYVIGRLDNHPDRSGFEAVKRVFHYHADHENEYRDLRSCARIALVAGPRADVGEFRGWFRILTEEHFLFDVVLDGVIDQSVLDRYQAVVLPNIAVLGDEQAVAIDRFVADGGTLVATGRTGFRDGSHELRGRPGLACLGIDGVTAVRSDLRGSYFEIGDGGGDRLALTDLVYMDDIYVEASYADSVRPLMRLVPPSPFGPPERAYYTEITDLPAFTVNEHVNGRAIYLPWLPGALFHRQGHPNTLDFTVDLLVGHAGLSPLGGNLSPMVEVTLHRMSDESSLLLHLVNGSGHFGVSYYHPVTMRDLEVAVPYHIEPSAVRCLVSGASCQWTLGEGLLTIRIRDLGAFEAVRIDGRDARTQT